MKSILHFLICLVATAGLSHALPFAFWKAAAGGGGGGGGPALVASTAAAGVPTGVTTSAIDTTGANLIVINVSYYYAATGLALTDSKSNTWTALTAYTEGTGSSGNRLYYCYGGTVGSGHTFTFSASDAYASMQVAAFSGITSAPIDQQMGSTGSGTTIATGSITPSQANTVVIAGLGHADNSAGAISIGGGFTITNTTAFVTGNALGSSMAYLILTSSTAQNPTWNLTNSVAGSAASIASFKY